MTVEILEMISILEQAFPECDWFSIMLDGGEDAVREYAEYMMNRELS